MQRKEKKSSGFSFSVLCVCVHWIVGLRNFAVCKRFILQKLIIKSTHSKQKWLRCDTLKIQGIEEWTKRQLFFYYEPTIHHDILLIVSFAAIIETYQMKRSFGSSRFALLIKAQKYTISWAAAVLIWIVVWQHFLFVSVRCICAFKLMCASEITIKKIITKRLMNEHFRRSYATYETF